MIMNSNVHFVLLSIFSVQSAVVAFVNPFIKPAVSATDNTDLLSLSAATGHAKNADNQNLQNIFYQNQAWKARKLVEDPNFFYDYNAKYSPEFMWIGPSDASVPPNVLIQEEAQNVFVTRNVANMVVENDMNQMSALEYAVEELEVKHIIVCGEYGTGSVSASSNMDLDAPLKLWLQEIRDLGKDYAAELDTMTDPVQRERRMVELNVVRQCLNLLQCESVKTRRQETYETGEAYLAPLIHAMVFDPNTGDLERVNIKFEDFADELSEIYGFRHLAD